MAEPDVVQASLLPVPVLGSMTAALSALQAGETQTFSITVRDQFTQPMHINDLTSWIAVGGTFDRSTGASVTFRAHENAFGSAKLIAHHAGFVAQRTINIGD